jgi:hypothetical protein
MKVLAPDLALSEALVEREASLALSGKTPQEWTVSQRELNDARAP